MIDFWIAGTPVWEESEGTDYHAVSRGLVSITPLHLDLTDYRGMASLGWVEDELGRIAAPEDGEAGADAAEGTAAEPRGATGE